MKNLLKNKWTITGFIILALSSLYLFWDYRTKKIEALIDAAVKGDIPRMELLVSEGVNPDGIAYDGLTPIVAATQRRQYGSITYLISIGVDINKGDESHFTPLSYAALQIDESMYDFLYNKGGRLKFQDAQDEKYILNSVSKSKNQELLKKVQAQIVREGSLIKN